MKKIFTSQNVTLVNFYKQLLYATHYQYKLED